MKEPNSDELLLRIARHLIMNASFLSNLGLYHGKMGIVLFFSHYARSTGNELYNDFAGELLDEIYEEIHTGIPVEFEAGLCGIGWGIEYLLQNGFMEGESNEILDEVDKKIMEWDLRRITDQSFKTGLEGITCYMQKRLTSPCRNPEIEPFDATYLSDWKSVVKSTDIPDDKSVLCSIMETLPEGEDMLSWKFGLENGCAGYGLKTLLS
jgi:hypothetical protein